MKKSLLVIAQIYIALASYGQWVEKSIFPSPRSSFRGLSMDSKLYLAGGFNVSGPSNTMDIYDETTDLWNVVNMPEVKLWPAYAIRNNGIYLFGGSNGSFHTSTSYVFKNGKWNPISDAPGTIYILQTTSLGGKIYMHKGSLLTDTVYIYGEQLDSWKTENLSVPRTRISVTNDGVRIYFAGGYSTSDKMQVSDVVDVYNTITGLWENTIHLSEARATICATYLNGKVYFAGGSLPGVDISSDVVDIYNINSKSWENPHSLIAARGWIQAAIVDTRIFFVGGGTWSSITSDIYNNVDSFDIYNEANDHWTGGTLKNPSYLGGVVATDKYVYCGGGAFVINGIGQSYNSKLDVHDGFVGIERMKPNAKINIYPNPSKGHIQVKGLQNEVEYMVFDLVGREMLSGTVSIENNLVNLTGLNSGQYFIRINGNTQILSIH